MKSLDTEKQSCLRCGHARHFHRPYCHLNGDKGGSCGCKEFVARPSDSVPEPESPEKVLTLKAAEELVAEIKSLKERNEVLGLALHNLVEFLNDQTDGYVDSSDLVAAARKELSR